MTAEKHDGVISNGGSAAEPSNTAELQRVFRAVVIGLVALAVAYGVASYFFLTERALVAWDEGLDLRYIAPENRMYFLLPIFVAALMSYQRLAVITSGSTGERLLLLRAVSLVILVATILASTGRAVLYNRHIQDALPAKYSLQQQGLEQLFLVAGPGGTTWTECLETLRLRGESLRCYEAPAGGIELTDYGRKKVADQMMERLNGSGIAALYSYLEIALLAASAGIALGVFVLIQRFRRRHSSVSRGVGHEAR